jgi:hypothetical protein
MRRGVWDLHPNTIYLPAHKVTKAITSLFIFVSCNACKETPNISIKGSGVICGVQYSHCCPPACPCASPCGTRSPPSGSACSSLVFPQSPRSPRPTALPPTGTERRVAPGTPSRSSLWETQWSEVTHHAAGTQEAPPCFKPAYRHHRQGLDHSVIGYVQFALLDFPSATLHSVQWL